jgi:hypothetical protein
MAIALNPMAIQASKGGMFRIGDKRLHLLRLSFWTGYPSLIALDWGSAQTALGGIHVLQQTAMRTHGTFYLQR